MMPMHMTLREAKLMNATYPVTSTWYHAMRQKLLALRKVASLRPDGGNHLAGLYFKWKLFEMPPVGSSKRRQPKQLTYSYRNYTVQVEMDGRRSTFYMSDLLELALRAHITRKDGE